MVAPVAVATFWVVFEPAPQADGDRPAFVEVSQYEIRVRFAWYWFQLEQEDLTCSALLDQPGARIVFSEAVELFVLPHWF